MLPRATLPLSALLVAGVLLLLGTPAIGAAPIDMIGVGSRLLPLHTLTAMSTRTTSAQRVHAAQPCGSGSNTGGCNSSGGGGVSSDEPSGQSSGTVQGGSTGPAYPTAGVGGGKGGVSSNEPGAQSSGVGPTGSSGPSYSNSGVGAGNGGVTSNEPGAQSSGAGATGSSGPSYPTVAPGSSGVVSNEPIGQSLGAYSVGSAGEDLLPQRAVDTSGDAPVGRRPRAEAPMHCATNEQGKSARRSCSEHTHQ